MRLTHCLLHLWGKSCIHVQYRASSTADYCFFLFVCFFKPVSFIWTNFICIVGDGVSGRCRPRSGTATEPKLSKKQGTTCHDPQNNLERTREETSGKAIQEEVPSPQLDGCVHAFVLCVCKFYMSELTLTIFLWIEEFLLQLQLANRSSNHNVSK